MKYGLRKWMRYLLLLPQAVIDSLSIAAFIIIFLTTDSTCWAWVNNIVILFIPEAIILTVVAILVPRYFFSAGSIYYQDLFDTKPEAVSRKHLTGYLRSRFSRKGKCIQYIAWGSKGLMIVGLFVKTAPPISNFFTGNWNFPMGTLWMWLLFWVFTSDIVWVELLSYIQNKNESTS